MGSTVGAAKGPAKDNTKDLKWSDPYYGVQHLLGVKKPYQVTVIDRGSLSEAFLMDRSRGFGEALSEGTFNTPAEAREWAERRYLVHIGAVQGLG